ncbi:hypothetical protein Tco_0058088, partial [Tanacetum coccineum]
NNRGKFRVGPPGYYTKTDNRPAYGENRQNSEELLVKHQEESARRITADQETSGPNKLHGVSFILGPESDTLEVLQHQLPPKELNPGSFTLPYTIGKFNFYAMADLDMSKKAPLGIVENILVKIDKFWFLMVHGDWISYLVLFVGVASCVKFRWQRETEVSGVELDMI